MVEVTKGAIIAIIGGAIVVIAALLPWWTFILQPYWKFNLNPLFGMKSPIPLPILITYDKLIILGGLLALAGGALLILTIVKRPLGIIGGCLALVGVIAFIVIMALGQVVIGPPYFWAYCPGLFGSNYYGTWALGIGLYVACVGAAIGLVGSLLGTKEA